MPITIQTTAEQEAIAAEVSGKTAQATAQDRWDEETASLLRLKRIRWFQGLTDAEQVTIYDAHQS